MNQRKKTIVKAVLVDHKGDACGFSKPLTSEELTGDVPISIEIDAEIDLRTATVEYATPSGILKKTSGKNFSALRAFPGYTVVIRR